MKKLRKILQVYTIELDYALINKYGAKRFLKNPKKHEKILTTFDIFFDRCLSIALDRNLINDEQRDELAELLKSQIKTDV